ncbi:LacI family DNA-binding transcriptional regulator [Phycisphaerales bacterium AB-hyl4]|uniref:LacI family DNA-binding transcriptional regulator n=1 Tax=Natronomicrosphaera hydrolytica TaxID=3242702 RepID=A0ABV4UBY4_9BACT
MATIRDVARKANVSTGTVSMYLNGRDGISESKRKQIEKAIRKLGYQARKRGRPRAVQQTQSRNIAFMLFGTNLDSLGDIHALKRQFIVGIRDALMMRQVHLSLFLDGRPIQEDDLFQDMVEHGQFDGVIITGADPEESDLEWLRAMQVPVILLNRPTADRDISFVTIDNESASAKVADHFYGQGHRRMAIVDHAGTYAWIRGRREGFLNRVRELDAELVAKERLDPDGPASTCHEVCDNIIKSGATAVFVVNDGMAVKCIDTWHEQGLEIPRDLSVVGFDDLGYRSQNDLRLSSVTYDKQAIGEYAVQMLMEKIDRPNIVMSMGMHLQGEIVDYDTTSQPPKTAR